MLLLALLWGVAGCTVGPDYKRPEILTPTEWRDPNEGADSLADLRWWQLFQDPVLQELIRTAFEENKDLRIAVARVAEARAQLAATRAYLFPQIDAEGRSSSIDPQQDFYRTSLDLSFELDLWGRLRRSTEAARADLLASVENQATVLTTLIGDVAQTYFDLLELDREADVDRRTLESRRASLDLVRRRQTAGLSSELDVLRAEGELKVAAAAVPDVERRIAQTENGLSVLLGHNPGPVRPGPLLGDQTMPPDLPTGLPSDLLERRPDIRAAEKRLTAANARIGAAKAEFFPRISLTGSFGVESVALSDLFTGPARAWQAGPTISWPIFQGGRILSNLRLTQAREQQAVIQYGQAVQQAFREVNDALVFHRKTQSIRQEREQRVVAAQRR